MSSYRNGRVALLGVIVGFLVCTTSRTHVFRSALRISTGRFRMASERNPSQPEKLMGNSTHRPYRLRIDEDVPKRLDPG